MTVLPSGKNGQGKMWHIKNALFLYHMEYVNECIYERCKGMYEEGECVVE